METATVLIIFIASLLLGVTGYSMYTAFGPGSKDLRDPFEDHGAIRSQLIFYVRCFEMINVYFHNCRLMQVQLYLNPAIFGKRLLRKCLHIIIV